MYYLLVDWSFLLGVCVRGGGGGGGGGLNAGDINFLNLLVRQGKQLL